MQQRYSFLYLRCINQLGLDFQYKCNRFSCTRDKSSRQKQDIVSLKCYFIFNLNAGVERGCYATDEVGINQTNYKQFILCLVTNVTILLALHYYEHYHYEKAIIVICLILKWTKQFCYQIKTSNHPCKNQSALINSAFVYNKTRSLRQGNHSRLNLHLFQGYGNIQMQLRTKLGSNILLEFATRFWEIQASWIRLISRQTTTSRMLLMFLLPTFISDGKIFLRLPQGATAKHKLS